MGKFGENSGGVGKSGVLEHKSGDISKTSKDRGKVTMEGLKLLRTILSPTPFGLLFPKIGGLHFATPPKTSIAIISGTGKATDFKFGRYIHKVHPNKSPLKVLEKRERRRIQGLPKVFMYPLLSQERVKLRTSNLAGTFSVSYTHLTLPMKRIV